MDCKICKNKYFWITLLFLGACFYLTLPGNASIYEFLWEDKPTDTKGCGKVEYINIPAPFSQNFQDQFLRDLLNAGVIKNIKTDKNGSFVSADIVQWPKAKEAAAIGERCFVQELQKILDGEPLKNPYTARKAIDQCEDEEIRKVKQ